MTSSSVELEPMLPFGDSRDETRAAARWHDNAESWQAAESITAHSLAASEAWVLKVVHDLGPISDEAIEDHARAVGAQWTGQRLRSARAALTVNEKHKNRPIRKGDQTSTTRTGRSCATWQLRETA